MVLSEPYWKSSVDGQISAHCQCTFKMGQSVVVVVVVVLVFYGPSTLRSFRARSVNLSTLFLGIPPRQFTST